MQPGLGRVLLRISASLHTVVEGGRLSVAKLWCGQSRGRWASRLRLGRVQTDIDRLCVTQNLFQSARFDRSSLGALPAHRSRLPPPDNDAASGRC